MKKYIIYTRVSTKKQGLGLDAQLITCRTYAAAHNAEIVAEYSEKESGKDTINRPILQQAIAECRKNGYVLLVAKVDRLSRDLADIFTLRKMRGFNFEVCDCDASDTMILGIMSALAEKERELISERTKAALAEKKAQGVKLGNPKAAETMRKYNHLGVEARQSKADNNTANKTAFAAIRFMNGTLREKAAYLNELGFMAPRGGQWSAMQVQRLITRFS